jgi:hypothetical protein
MELGPELAGGRSGIARSGPVTTQLEAVVATRNDAQPGAPMQARSQSRRVTGAAEGRAESARPTDSSAPSQAPAAQAAPSAAPARAPADTPMRDLPVTMRAIACPSR